MPRKALALEFKGTIPMHPRVRWTVTGGAVVKYVDQDCPVAIFINRDTAHNFVRVHNLNHGKDFQLEVVSGDFRAYLRRNK